MAAKVVEVTNERTLPCVLVGLPQPSSFAIVPHRNTPLKKHFFVLDTRDMTTTYQVDPTMFTVQQKRRRKMVRVSELYGSVSRLSEDEFRALDMVHATMTIVDFVPDHLRFALDKPQGPALTALTFASEAEAEAETVPKTTRADELRLLRDLGFDGGIARHSCATFKDLQIAPEDLHFTIPRIAPADIEAKELEHALKLERGMVECFEAMVRDGRIDKDFDPNPCVHVTVCVEHLRFLAVASVSLVVQGSTYHVPNVSESAVLEEYERIVELKFIAHERRRQVRCARKVSARAVDVNMDILKDGLFGSLRIAASQASLYVCYAFLSSVDVDDPDVQRAMDAVRVDPPATGTELDRPFVDGLHAFVSDDTLFEAVASLIGDDPAAVAALRRRRATFLGAHDADDAAALLAIQRHEFHFYKQDQRFASMRDAWVALASVLDHDI